MRFVKSTVVFWLFAGLICLSGANAAFAEFYKYKDENGKIRFTDDLSQVPEDQRQKLGIYDEPADFGIEPEKPAESEEKNKPKPPTYKQLKEEEEALAKELDELKKEKEKLPAPDDKSYRTKVDRLNKKIQEYEEKRAAYNKKVKEYNDARKKEE